MRLSKRKYGSPIGVSLTPMIDIVFLLIIFFMTLPQLSRVVFHPVELPTVQKIDADDKTQTITINIDRGGNIFIDGKQMSLDQTESRLKFLMTGENAAERIGVLLRADGKNQSGAVNEMVDLLNRLGIKQVRISARSLK